MKPLDPRLLRYARATRWFLAAAVLTGVLGAVLLVAQATLLAEAIVTVFRTGAGPDGIRGTLVALALILAGRAGLAWVQEVAAFRAAAAVKSDLRQAVLRRAATSAGAPEAGVAEDGAAQEGAAQDGSGGAGDHGAGGLAALVSRGVDALDGYFARYLPQLVLAVVVPVIVGTRLLAADWLTALIVGLTLPLIPVFMILIGRWTKARTDRQFDALSRMSGHFLDVVTGLPTLVGFGRASAQVATVRRITDDYRRTTMGVLRAAFLSSLVLELLATLSVALVAVSVGLRLVDGSLTLQTGLLVLILAPEVYLPLRAVGAQFHASAEGLEAAEKVFAVLESPAPTPGTRTDLVLGDLVLDAVTVHYPDRGEPALDHASMTFPSGRVTALVGASGTGKSTVVAALLGLVRPVSGTVRIGGTDVADLDPATYWASVAWVPQRPALVVGSIAANIRLGRPDATGSAVALAAERAALDPASFPDGLETLVGEDGAGLSAGERQRVGLARAFLRNPRIVLLDEPTANLDPQTEQRIRGALRTWLPGRTAVLVTHRTELLALADHEMSLAPVTSGSTVVTSAPAPTAAEGVAA
ncbi:thiol reductant ABC exporter subunit CydD [Cryptosporangium sp. NPDC051539]|uniref:thiol reductant ABC exporter subunit CydD n=1 Tax=Cryptosporangium sp. NPDC051539 TaxID=3363962 RepID=UPI0037A081D9